MGPKDNHVLVTIPSILITAADSGAAHEDIITIIIHQQHS